jgi:hypothetical protein
MSHKEPGEGDAHIRAALRKGFRGRLYLRGSPHLQRAIDRLAAGRPGGVIDNVPGAPIKSMLLHEIRPITACGTSGGCAPALGSGRHVPQAADGMRQLVPRRQPGGGFDAHAASW